MTQLKAYIKVEDLQNQVAAYLGAQARSRDFAPMPGDHCLMIEATAPLELAIDKIAKTTPGIDIARQGKLLELHSHDPRELTKAGNGILRMFGAKVADQTKPEPGFSEIIEEISEQLAQMLNRSRRGSMVAPGESLLIYDVTPAPAALLGANEAEKVAPDLTLVDLQEVGSMGRLYLSGSKTQLAIAKERIDQLLTDSKSSG